MRRLWIYARRHRGRVLWGCLLLLGTNAAAMTVPQLFRIAVDGMQAGAPLALLRELAVTLLAVALAGGVVRTLSRVHLFYAARDVELELRCDFYAHLARQPPAFFEAHPTGDLMSRATNDLSSVRLLLGPGVLNMVNTVVAYAVALPLMFRISVELTLLGLAIYPPSLLLVIRLSRRLFTHNRAQQEELGRISNFVQEALAGSAVVRAFGLESAQVERFRRQNQDYYTANVRLAWVRSYMWRLTAALASVGSLVTVYLGARQVMQAQITTGQLVALIEYLALLSWPSFTLGWVITLWQRGVASMERIDAIMNCAPAIVSGPLRPDRLAPTFAVRHLSLDLDGRRVLDDVSFEAPAGATVGIVGPIGSGKSLLTRALVRHLDVPRGAVWVGGVDIVDLDLATLRGAFGFVHQNPLLFSKSVAENVAFGKPAATPSAVQQALELAAFTGDLAILPNGLETPVGERGITLSGGQKQRVAIARALLLEPAILVLDDALSSVDTETEARILTGLRALRAGKTTVIVAHRVTAVQHADRIIVLDGGRIIERGDHSGLMAAGGLYASLAHRQRLERDLERLGERRPG